MFILRFVSCFDTRHLLSRNKASSQAHPHSRAQWKQFKIKVLLDQIMFWFFRDSSHVVSQKMYKDVHQSRVAEIEKTSRAWPLSDEDLFRSEKQEIKRIQQPFQSYSFRLVDSWVTKIFTPSYTHEYPNSYKTLPNWESTCIYCFASVVSAQTKHHMAIRAAKCRHCNCESSDGSKQIYELGVLTTASIFFEKSVFASSKCNKVSTVWTWQVLGGSLID